MDLSAETCAVFAQILPVFLLAVYISGDFQKELKAFLAYRVIQTAWFILVLSTEWVLIASLDHGLEGPIGFYAFFGVAMSVVFLLLEGLFATWGGRE